MEKPTIEKMNSVIAEYNGTVEIFNDSKKGKINLYHNELINSNIGYEIHELKYHSSLDWLYPVWQKVKKDEKYLYKVDAISFEISGRIDVIELLLSNAATISEIHEAIYNAIVWLNDNTLNQTK